MSKISTMDTFSRNAVENFVQTVVFVDDKIYVSPPMGTVLEEKKASAPKTRKPSTKSTEKKISRASVVALEKPEEMPPFSPHDIQASFAKKRIVCSLHQPPKKIQLGSNQIHISCAHVQIL